MNTWLEGIWWRSQPPPPALQPLARLYASVADRLAKRRRQRATHLRVPVIVVGNIAVGGTGKTPITLWLLDLLRAMGHVPGVISRGYGGSGPYPLLLTPLSTPAMAGDEPVLIAQRSGAPVCVAPRRVQAAQCLLKAHPAVDVLICDDGLQHLALARNMELCVVDGSRGHGNGWRLPAGPLREPPSRLASCDWVLVNGADAIPYGNHALRFDLGGDLAINLATGAQRPLASFAGAGLHAVAGIGNPPRFFAMLRASGLTVWEHPFADHHAYVAADLRFDDDAEVLMTEKDAVKCAGFDHPRLWSVPVGAQFKPPDANRLQDSLRQLLARPR